MDFAKIRPRGGTKAQWEKANPVLAKREIGVQWETMIGVGEVVIKIGDGVTDWINLPEAVKSDITKKIIAALAVVPDDNPDLADGDSLDTLFGKIAKKFKYLNDNKLDKSARYDGTDSTSTELVPTANALRVVNAKADKNASDITTTNNNLSKLNGKMLGSNYVMNYSDFSDLSVNVYSVETFATTPSGNAPENNVGDFRITRLGMNNSKYNTLILTSPRYKTSVSMSQEFYVGNFWDGIWMGWERLANKSALDNLTSLYNTTKANYEKGSTFLDDISPLSFPSQLKHAGFYKLPTMTADVNADAGSETMTEYTTGDFYGLLLGEDINTTDGCVYGTLIVSSPRIKSAIWVGNIWQKKFISWYKIGKS